MVFVPIKNASLKIHSQQRLLGDLAHCVPPLPIPNREVKAMGADGTHPNTVGRVGFAEKSLLRIKKSLLNQALFVH